MKKTLVYFLALFTLSIVLIVLYFNLPFEITRKSDIKYGNQLIKNIKTYQIQNNSLPNSNDIKNLEKLGFDIYMMETKPYYECNQNNEYEIVFLEGFDGPYLMWNSREKKWKMDNLTIFTKAQ